MTTSKIALITSLSLILGTLSFSHQADAQVCVGCDAARQALVVEQDKMNDLVDARTKALANLEKKCGGTFVLNEKDQSLSLSLGDNGKKLSCIPLKDAVQRAQKAVLAAVHNPSRKAAVLLMGKQCGRTNPIGKDPTTLGRSVLAKQDPNCVKISAV